MRTMKRYTRKWIALTVVILAVGGFLRTNAQIGLAEVIRAGIKRVVRAVDLKVQRLQNRTIWLQNAQKVLENSLSRLKATGNFRMDPETYRAIPRPLPTV